MKYLIILSTLLLVGCGSGDGGLPSTNSPDSKPQGAKISAIFNYPDFVPPTGRPTYGATVRGKNIGDAPSLVFTLTISDLGTGWHQTVSGDNLDPGQEQTLYVPLWNTGGDTGTHNFKAKIMDGQEWTFTVEFTKSYGG